MIRKPSEIREGQKKIRMLIAGYPGIGKTTLALSAPNPLHIDVDFGIDRVEPIYRKDYIQPANYDEILTDLQPANVQDYRSLMVDGLMPVARARSACVQRRSPRRVDSKILIMSAKPLYGRLYL